MVAYHFPPMTVSSGVQRTLNFVRHLREHGWEPIVLTASARAYSATGPEQLDEIPTQMRVERAFALDTARHLAIAGRYPNILANPDRWASWLPFAVRAGRRLIVEERPDAIFSTFPIATAHAIGRRLAAHSNLPWIADYRDSMFDDGYPEGERARAIAAKLDREVVEHCTRAIFTTPSAHNMYAARYPALPKDRWAVIPNGYDEAAFQRLTPGDYAAHDGPLQLLHSGTLYPVERDPLPFFNALRRLKADNVIDAATLCLRLRATGHDDHYRQLIDELGLGDLVRLLPALPYGEALAEMMQVDGLLLMQAEGCNHQIPAKLYEYLRARRPIITLTHPAGDTAAVLREAQADNLLRLDDEELLYSALPGLLDKLKQRALRIAPMERVASYSRAQGAANLARILDQATAP